MGMNTYPSDFSDPPVLSYSYSGISNMSNTSSNIDCYYNYGSYENEEVAENFSPVSSTFTIPNISFLKS